MKLDTQITMFDEEGNPKYKEFVDKFKPKKTTDDCYTPQNIYEAVRNWVFERYGLDADTRVVRPFWPGGDYTREDYSGKCVVIDNPPFSILAKIVGDYEAAGIHYFLFAPGLTLFSANKVRPNYVVVGARIEYANSANVNTSFVTDMGAYRIEVAPDLNERIERENKKNIRERTKSLPKYEMPPEIVTSARLNYLAKHGARLLIRADECVRINRIDSMDKRGKEPFGGAFLLSEKAAAEKAAAEKAAAEKAAAEKAAAERVDTIRFQLSEREREMQRRIGK